MSPVGGNNKLHDDCTPVTPRRRGTSSYSPLPRCELLIYIIVEVAAVVGAIYSVYCESIDRFRWIHPSFLSDGWSWLGRKQDIADFEWSFWFRTLWQLLPWYAAHFLLGKLLEQISLKVRNLGYLLFALVYLFHVFGWRILLLFVTHGCVMFLATSSGSPAIVWVVSIGLMLFTTLEGPRIFITSLMNPTRNIEESVFLIIGELVKVNLKYTSFCLEKVKNTTTHYKAPHHKHFDQNHYKAPHHKHFDQNHYKAPHHNNFNQNHCKAPHHKNFEQNHYKAPHHNKFEQNSHGSTSLQSEKVELCKSLNPSDHYSLVDLFQYMFYFPLFFSAPVVTYDTFRTEINQHPSPWNRKKVFDVILVFSRIAFWAFFIEFSLHYVYFTALMFNPFVLKRASHWTLMGISYLQGQFKMVKFVVIYGLTGELAHLDGLEVPGPPSCISYIYRYSQMWKLFDKGTYNFTKRYIYIPIGGSKAGLSRKLFGSFVCFMFFYSYHGLDFYLLVWSLLNFIELVLEVCATLIENTETVQRFETRYLTPLWVRRIHAVCAIPLFYISIFAIFYFFADKQVGDIYINRNFVNGTMTSFFTGYTIFYCSIQVAMEIQGCKERLVLKNADSVVQIKAKTSLKTFKNKNKLKNNKHI